MLITTSLLTAALLVEDINDKVKTMKTNAQRDDLLKSVSGTIERILKAHNMCIMAEDIATNIILRHTQNNSDGQLTERVIKLEIMPF